MVGGFERERVEDSVLVERKKACWGMGSSLASA